MSLITNECSIRIIPDVITKTTKTFFIEDESKDWVINTTKLDGKVAHKVPIGQLVTLNFTTNPNYNTKSKKKDKKKLKAAKSKKPRKTRFEDIIVPRDPHSVIPRKDILGLATNVINKRLDAMKKKFNVNEFMFSTEPILEWNPASGDDPNKYLDFIKDIDEEMIKYEPYEVCFDHPD